MTERAPIISDAHGSFWDEHNPNTPALYSNIKTSSKPTCCECDMIQNKKFHQHRGHFTAKGVYKDHPCFHSIDSYQTCSNHLYAKEIQEPTDKEKWLSDGPVFKKQGLSYLDYLKGKPEPKPMSPIKLDHEKDDDLGECQWHHHDDYNYPEEILTRGPPDVENASTQQKVSPIFGQDY